MQTNHFCCFLKDNKDMSLIISPPSSPLPPSTSSYLKAIFSADTTVYFEMIQVHGNPWGMLIPVSAQDKKNRFLGQGNHACVYKSVSPINLNILTDSISTEFIAVKVFHKEESDALFLSLKEFYYQSELFNSCPSVVLRAFGIILAYNGGLFFLTRADGSVNNFYPNLISISDVRYTQVGLLMELGPSGPLSNIPHSLVTKKFIISIGVQLGNILKSLLSHNLVHGDIKPHNLFPIFTNNNDLQLKLGDFSSSITLTSSSTLHISGGTQVYLAPDLLTSPNLTIEAILGCDTYSVGVTLWTLITGIIPFKGISSSVHRLIAIKKGFFECGQNSWIYSLNYDASLLLSSGEELSPELSKRITSIIEEMLHKNAINRPTSEEIVSVFQEI